MHTHVSRNTCNIYTLSHFLIVFYLKFQTNLLLHSVTHNVDDLECPECHKIFSRAAGLRAHIILHEREESLFCTECGDEFSNQVRVRIYVPVLIKMYLYVILFIYVHNMGSNHAF